METELYLSAASDPGSIDQLVVFTLDGWRYALRLAAVERIVRIAEITPLPKAPEIVLGIVNAQGRIVPVVNVRKRFRLPDRDVSLSDHLVVARTSKRFVALVVDAVAGVVARGEAEMTATGAILPCLQFVEGVVKLDDGLIFIHDLDTFLSLEEEKTLEHAMMPT
jgi:purine-binding chemotaxis protein CheW